MWQTHELAMNRDLPMTDRGLPHGGANPTLMDQPFRARLRTSKRNRQDPVRSCALLHAVCDEAYDAPMEAGSAAETKQPPEDILGIFPTTILEQLSLPALFGNDHPVEVDLGSGPGSFLVEAAERFSERNFLGVERLLGRVRKTCRKAWHRGIRNLRVLRLEIDYTVRYLIPSNSIARFHLYFPDPWPKRRHVGRRIADAEFFEALWGALINSGEVWIKTDHHEYFEQIERLLARTEHRFVPTEWSDEPYPVTDFEAEFLERNLRIYRLRLRKRA